MGITDRRYMKDSGSSFGAFRGREINAVTLLVLINAAVWLVWQFASRGDALHGFMQSHFTLSNAGVFQRYWIHTLLTSAVSHIDFYHILFNMLFLWYLGRDLEVFYGRNNTVALYVFAALVSSLAYCGVNMVRNSDAPALGASGAVMGFAVAAAFIDPHKPMMIFGIIPVPLWALAAVYCVSDLAGMLQDHDHIAHAAHLGGAFAGLLFYKLDLRVFSSRGRTNSGMMFRLKQWWRGRQFAIVERQREASEADTNPPDETELVAAHRARATRAESRDRRDRKGDVEPFLPRIDPETSQRVDELLAKISKEGIGALSPDEREFLKQSSEKYRK